MVYSSNVASVLESLCFLTSWRVDLLKQSSSLGPPRSNKIWSHSVVIVSLWYWSKISGQIRSWWSESFSFHHEWSVLTFHLSTSRKCSHTYLLFFFGSNSAIIACLVSFQVIQSQLHHNHYLHWARCNFFVESFMVDSWLCIDVVLVVVVERDAEISVPYVYDCFFRYR